MLPESMRRHCDWKRQAALHKQLMLPIMQCLPLVPLGIIL